MMWAVCHGPGVVATRRLHGGDSCGPPRRDGCFQLLRGIGQTCSGLSRSLRSSPTFADTRTPVLPKRCLVQEKLGDLDPLCLADGIECGSPTHLTEGSRL